MLSLTTSTRPILSPIDATLWKNLAYRELRPDELPELVRQGLLISPVLHNYKRNRSDSNWKSMDIICVDCDTPELTFDQAKQHPLVKQYATFLHTTRSHQQLKNGVVCDRFRIVFMFRETITDPLLIRLINHAFVKLLNHDPQCIDPGRFFYGNRYALIHKVSFANELNIDKLLIQYATEFPEDYNKQICDLANINHDVTTDIIDAFPIEEETKELLKVNQTTLEIPVPNHLNQLFLKPDFHNNDFPLNVKQKYKDLSMPKLSGEDEKDYYTWLKDFYSDLGFNTHGQYYRTTIKDGNIEYIPQIPEGKKQLDQKNHFEIYKFWKEEIKQHRTYKKDTVARQRVADLDIKCMSDEKLPHFSRITQTYSLDLTSESLVIHVQNPLHLRWEAPVEAAQKILTLIPHKPIYMETFYNSGECIIYYRKEAGTYSLEGFQDYLQRQITYGGINIAVNQQVPLPQSYYAIPLDIPTFLEKGLCEDARHQHETTVVSLKKEGEEDKIPFTYFEFFARNHKDKHLGKEPIYISRRVSKKSIIDSSQDLIITDGKRVTNSRKIVSKCLINGNFDVESIWQTVLALTKSSKDFRAYGIEWYKAYVYKLANKFIQTFKPLARNKGFVSNLDHIPNYLSTQRIVRKFLNGKGLNYPHIEITIMELIGYMVYQEKRDTRLDPRKVKKRIIHELFNNGFNFSCDWFTGLKQHYGITLERHILRGIIFSMGFLEEMRWGEGRNYIHCDTVGMAKIHHLTYGKSRINSFKRLMQWFKDHTPSSLPLKEYAVALLSLSSLGATQIPSFSCQWGKLSRFAACDPPFS